MGQIQNVQRGILFTFFIYSVVLFAAFVIKFVKNWVDKEVKIDADDDEAAAKYADKPADKKAQESNNELQASKKPDDKKKQKAPKPSDQSEITLDQVVLKAIQPTVLLDQETILTKILGKLRHHVFYHLPYFFPIALNVTIGTSYAFIFVLFFFLQVSFGLFNDLKIHQNCSQNKIIKCIVEHLGLILTFFAWVNVWGAMTSSMPFYIQKNTA